MINGVELTHRQMLENGIKVVQSDIDHLREKLNDKITALQVLRTALSRELRDELVEKVLTELNS